MPGGELRGWRAGGSKVRRLLAWSALLVVAALSMGASTQNAQTCPAPVTVDLITGASASDVLGVVEYEVIAENVVGLGASVGATKRLWGDVVADRWMVVPSGSRCAETPATGLGDHWYLLVGRTNESGGPVFGVPSATEVSDLETGALAAIVGEPVTFEIGALDRGMAWMRVNWWLILLVLVVLVAVVAVVHHRTSNSRRDYLF